jgi:hypothetical protein
MVYRYSRIAGAAGLGFAVFELGRLLRPSVEGAPWQFVVIAGIVLGAVLTWTALTYRVPAWATILINAAAFVVAAVRLVAPDTTVAFLPTASSFSVLGDELSFAFEIIRNGIAPVASVAGLVVIVTAVMWATAGILVWGLMRGHPYVAVIPPLVLVVQFTIMDRIPTGAAFTILFIVLVAATFLAVAADERATAAGRLVRPTGWTPTRRPLPAASAVLLGITIVATVVTSGVAGGLVPSDGVLEWRTSSGLTGNYFGGVSYNPFISIQQRLVNQTPVVVFTAELDDQSLAGDLSYRLITMETFDGSQFFADRPEVVAPEDVWENPAQAYAGPTRTVTQDIEIRALQMDWLPAAYTPVAFSADASTGRLIRVRTDDGALRLDGGLTRRGMQYRVVSEVPLLDLSVLTVGEDGTLSPAFEQAAEAGALAITPGSGEVREEPPDVERYLDLPDDVNAAIGAEARRAVDNLETDFERGLALEAFFRDPANGFRYTTDIQPGHAATDIAAWLTAEDSPSYRRGYCEQYATSMAVMARTLDIPSRVVLGFTPGDLQSDGTVIVRDANAHAWVELWMPQQGWVKFDPTPRSDNANPSTLGSLGFDVRPFLELPEPEVPDAGSIPNPPVPFGGEDEPQVFPGGSGGAEETGGIALPSWLRIVAVVLGAALALLGAVPALKWWRRRRRMRRLEQGDVTAAWEEIVSRLSDLGHEPDPSLTPTEVAATVDPAMTPLAAVYSERIYGSAGASTPAQVDLATRSLRTVENGFTTRYSPAQRLTAWYRPATLIPARVRRLARRRR